MKKSVLFLINGLGIEKAGSYSIAIDQCMPKLSRVKETSFFTTAIIDSLEYRSAYEQYQKAVDKNFLHFYAILALTMKEDYMWREDDTHDQISSLLERVDKKINKYAKMGYTTEDIVKLVEEKTEIVLMADEH